MTVKQAFRYELDPTSRQANLLVRAAGTARYVFNWGLNLARGLLNKGFPIPSAPELHRLWNVFKREKRALVVRGVEMRSARGAA